MPEDYGLVAMAGVLLGVISLFNEFGLGAAVVALRNITEDQIANIHGLASMFGVAGLLVSCLVAIPTAHFFGAPEVARIMMVMGAGLVLVAMRSVPTAVLEKELRFKFLAFLEGGQSIVATLATLGLAWWGAGYWALVGGGLIGSAAATAVLSVYRPLRRGWPTMRSLQEVVRFSSHVLVSRVSGYIATSSDLFIAGRMLGEAVVGVYSFATTIAYIPMEKVTGLASRVMPAFYSSVQTDPTALRRYLLFLTEGVSLITFPMGVGVAFLSGDGVVFLLGEKWVGVVAPLEILACWAVFRSVFALISPILFVTGGSRLAMFISLLCAILYPIGFLVGSHWGAVGLAVAWIIVQPPTWVPIYRQVLQATGLSVRAYLGSLWPAFSGVISMAGGIYLFLQIFPEDVSISLRLLSEVACGAAVYVGVICAFHYDRLLLLVKFVRSSRDYAFRQSTAIG
jgi:PST family polysaccharide transporter